jgi:single-stranded-DNA-specific exonuclease
MNKKWIPKLSPDPDDVQRLAASIGIPIPLSHLLCLRGINSEEKAKAFFRPSLDMLHDPFLMKDMDKAVDRLSEALQNGEKILVYGDYDVDGTTAVTLMFSFLKNLGATCDYYIPDRYGEGYGFSMAGVEYAHANQFSLIITLDCGIKDAEKVAHAKSLGIDVVICDHHNPGVLPEAVAVLDTKRPDCDYPYEGLSGCGVGFKLLQAFCIRHNMDQKILLPYLDLVTIAIGADIVPITGENRVLASFGMDLLQTNRRPGIQAMLDQAGFKKDKLTITDVVFIIAPRINAAGRIFSGKQAVELLLTESIEEAAKLSPALEENNNTRRGLDKEITEEAIQTIDNEAFYQSSFTSVVRGDTWHKGVVGIVASRLVETYYKPAVVLVETDQKLAGSARSIPGVDLFEALGECSDLLVQFGGHTMAAGLSLKAENFEAFRQKFDKAVETMLHGVRPTPYVEYDLELKPEDITSRFYRILVQFAPFGPENMRPSFLMKNMINAGNTRAVGDTGAHLKLHLKSADPESSISFDGISFFQGHWNDALVKQNAAVDILFVLEENEWNGKITLQLNVKDIRLAE